MLTRCWYDGELIYAKKASQGSRALELPGSLVHAALVFTYLVPDLCDQRVSI